VQAGGCAGTMLSRSRVFRALRGCDRWCDGTMDVFDNMDPSATAQATATRCVLTIGELT
jgi:hypothetical protein